MQMSAKNVNWVHLRWYLSELSAFSAQMQMSANECKLRAHEQKTIQIGINECKLSAH